MYCIREVGFGGGWHKLQVWFIYHFLPKHLHMDRVDGGQCTQHTYSGVTLVHQMEGAGVTYKMSTYTTKVTFECQHSLI